MIYRVTFGFDGQGVGWSETHACRNASTLPADVMPGAIAVAQKRVTFLGREFRINSIRISRYSDDGATTRARGVSLVKQEFKNPIQLVAQAAEPASVALLARGVTGGQLAPAAFQANVNQTFLGAPADDAVNNGGDVDPGKAGLGAAFGQWAAAMLANHFGWLVSNTIADLEIVNISQNTNGTVELVTTAAPAGVLTLGKSYTARIRRVNAGVSPLNGQVIVRSMVGNILNTQQVIGLGLNQAGGSIRLYSQIAPFAEYAGLVLMGTVGKHKRGRPFGFSPGRARRRIRG
jgi:hypothetical protein